MENVLHPMSRSRTDWNVGLGVGVWEWEVPLFSHDAHRSFDKQQNGRPCEEEVSSDF